MYVNFHERECLCNLNFNVREFLISCNVDFWLFHFCCSTSSRLDKAFWQAWVYDFDGSTFILMRCYTRSLSASTFRRRHFQLWFLVGVSRRFWVWVSRRFVFAISSVGWYEWETIADLDDSSRQQFCVKYFRNIATSLCDGSMVWLRWIICVWVVLVEHWHLTWGISIYARIFQAFCRLCAFQGVNFWRILFWVLVWSSLT